MSVLKKAFIVLTSAGLVASSVIVSSMYLSSITIQEPVSSEESTVPSSSGYTYHASSGLSDGIHTVNDSQNDSDLEMVMDKIRRETE